MDEHEILILKGPEVASLLVGRETEVIHTVRAAYETHAKGDSSLPHSTFLHFPGAPRNRIIALPAYVGGGFRVAGMKWIASFPGNREIGLDRASAVVILNSPMTGRLEAIIEGSIISAKRTAASAVLAAQCLQTGVSTAVGIIGCGLINFEIARFLLSAYPHLEAFIVFDTVIERAQQFRDKCRAVLCGEKDIEVMIAESVGSVLRSSVLISMATTAIEPHIRDLSECPPGSTVLHISLRDIAPEALLSCDNIVDDADHVCRAQTSVHRVEQLVGNRDFIRCTLADILRGATSARRDSRNTAVFSPFGLGALDIAVGKLVCDLARAESRGTVMRSFLPDPWVQRSENKGASRESSHL